MPENKPTVQEEECGNSIHFKLITHSISNVLLLNDSQSHGYVKYYYIVASCCTSFSK
jgi:hypothetical protein